MGKNTNSFKDIIKSALRATMEEEGHQIRKETADVALRLMTQELSALARQEMSGVDGKVDTIIQATFEKCQKMMGEFNTQMEEFKTKLKETEERHAQATPVMEVKVNGDKSVQLDEPMAECLPRMLALVKKGEQPMLVGPAGCGKTTAARQLAKVLGLEFGMINVTSGASESWIFGRQTTREVIESHCMKLAKQSGNGGAFLIDEIDCGDPNFLAAAHSVADRSPVFYNPITQELVEKHPDFICLASANTAGKGADYVYTGRNRIDAATLDRFVVVPVDYSPQVEAQVCPNETVREYLQTARKILRELNSEEIISTRTLRQVLVQYNAGIAWKDILSSVTAGWPEQLITETKLVEEQVPQSLR